MIIIPIRTESDIHRTPLVNYALIGLNVLLYLAFSGLLSGTDATAFKTRVLAFHSNAPAMHQFFTYQFVHADIFHVLGNMLFLWVFGNHVNAKMGNLPYLMFYLAGGVFAAWGYALLAPGPSHLIGASGAVAAVTTAYLALAPRSRVTVLVWLFIFIHFFEVRAMVVIGLKIIVWDNIVAPMLSGADSVAQSAHLAGYLFGFVSALGLLLLRALPRDQFDILAVWKRWNQRREFAAVTKEPGTVGQTEPIDPKERAIEEQRFDRVADLRTRITDGLERSDLSAAIGLHEELVSVDPQQCLSERHQLDVAREYYRLERFAQAAAAFDRYLECYPTSTEVHNVRLLLGIVYARDLKQFEEAEKHLVESMDKLGDETRRDQCFQWLHHVRTALGRPAPEA